MKKIILIIYTCVLALICYGQEYECDFSYVHFTGESGRNPVIMDLMIINGELNGSCVFLDQGYPDGASAGMLRTQRLEGSLDGHDVASIYAYEQNMLAGTYTGVLGKEFNGTFREEGSQNSHTFSFREEYSDFALPFHAYCLSRDSLLLDTTGSPFAHLEHYLLLPPHKQKYESIRESIVTGFLGQNIDLNTSNDSLLHYSGMEYFRKYVEGNRDLYDGGMSFNWESIKTSYIGMNHYGLLVYRIESYGYTGGAHGMGASSFLVFDTESMKELRLDDIFIPDHEYELKQLLERSFRTNYFVGAEQSLKEAGLFENEIPPTENFFLTENSIGFYYNPYHLAPYAMGAQVISLLWDEVEHLVREDAAVRRIIR